MRYATPARRFARATFSTGVTGAALVAFGVGQVWAQTVPAELEEVVVTAQKREQAIKDVPISITAIGSQQLEALRATSVVDYITEIPNATFISFGAFGSAVSLRGINGFSGGIFAPIAILIDDAGFGAANITGMLNAQFMDLERVEVMRGPQGVLSGRNALGGAINLVTAKPDFDELQFKGTLDYGRYQTTYVQGVLNAPLAETVAVRLVAYKEDSDGSVKNLGPSGGTSSTDNAGGRVAVRWKPTDALTIDASYAYDDQDYGLGEMLRADIFASPEARQTMLDELAEWGGDFNDTTFFEDGGINGGTVRLDVDEKTTYETAIAALSVSYEVADHTIELKYSNYDYENSIVFDWDKTEFSWLRGVWGSETESDSAEIKVSSQYDGPLNWVAGVGYLDEETGYPSSDDIGTWVDDETLPPLAGAYRQQNVNDYRIFLESVGFFANLFYDVGERWHLSIGGRYSVEKTQIGSYYIEDPEDPRFFPGAPLQSEDMSTEAKISEFSPRVAINYDLTDGLTTYFQYATGYRAGYGNNAEAALYGLPMDVQPEKVSNYELGLKGQLLDNRLSFALSLFYMQYEDLQVTLTIGNPGSNPLDPPVSYDSNAGESVSQGVEFEGAFRVTDGLTLSGGFAYTDAELDEFTVYDVAPDPDLEGAVIVVPTTFRNTPVLGIRPWTASLRATYERQLTDGMRGTARVSYQYQDDVYTEGLIESESQVYKVPKYETVDLDLGIGALDDRWTLTAYAENILDEDYFLSTQFEADTSRRGGFVSFLPRTYGLRVTFTF
jgi:iron complex outermembrane receptor protein